MIIDKLKAIVGSRGWTQDADRLEPHLTEWRGALRGATAIMVSPASTAEVAAVVRACAETGVGIVPQGGNTGLCGGAIPDASGRQILLSLSRMNRIRSVDADDFSLIAEAGCVLADVQAAAEKAQRLFALSLAAEGSCQIGGNLATDAGGINVIRYGTARQQVLGLEVVLADGSIWEGLRTLRKNTAGYDLKQLFLGSEGTLGIITAAALRLLPLPGDTFTSFVALPTVDDAVELLGLLRKRCTDRVQAFELISDTAMSFVERHISDAKCPFEQRHEWYGLIEVAASDAGGGVEAALAEALEAGLAADAVVAKSTRESQLFWRLRHSISEAQKPEGANLKHDIAVPIGRVGRFLRESQQLLARHAPEARPVIFGHVGDGNLHYNIAQPDDADADQFRRDGYAITEKLYELTIGMGGTISAEHGIGVLKKEALNTYTSDVELGLMRALKTALDPENTMNPGKVI